MIIYIVDLLLVDLSDDEGRFLQLEHTEKFEIRKYNYNSMGFLPNGDLVIVSRDYKIYSYSVRNKPTTNTTLWKCSQIHDIEITESLKVDEICCFIYQTKLFFLSKRLIIQWNLLKMTFDKQYFPDLPCGDIVINKNQTLLALKTKNLNENKYKIEVFSMETGMHVSGYG